MKWYSNLKADVQKINGEVSKRPGVGNNPKGLFQNLAN